MQPVENLTRISRAVSPQDSALIASAVRQDPFVWNALGEDDLVEKALARAELGLAEWTPASLSLLALSSPLQAQAFCAKPMIEPDGAMLQQAVHTCDLLINTGQTISTLEDAGLVALALRDRYRRSRSWDGLFDLSSIHLVLASPAATAAWRSSLACLYGLIPDQRGFLQALVSNQAPSPTLEWACHCILCSPAPAQAMVEAMADLLVDLPIEIQLDWLKQLQLKGRSDLCEPLAQTLVNGSQPAHSELWGKRSPAEIDPAEAPAQSQRLQQMATLYQIAGYTPQALALLEKAQALLQHNLASVHLQAAGIPGADILSWLASPEAREMVKKALVAARPQTDLVLGAAIRGNNDDLAELLPEKSHNPLVMLHQARAIEAQGDPSEAQDIARQAVPLLVDQLNDTSPVWMNSSFAWNPALVLAQLEKLELSAEAARCAVDMLAARPSDLALVAQASRVFQKAGQGDRGLELAQLAVLLAPQDPDQHRRLASVYESCGEWKKSLEERELLVTLESQPSTMDWLDLARDAYHAGSHQRAMDVCGQILEREPDQGTAHALTGLVLLVKGQREDAAAHLTRATLLVPEEPQPWLSLSQILKENGEPQRALETLRAAVLAAPGSAELHLALAEACLENHLPSEALPFLQEAARLNPESPEVAWKLGKTLHDLGHAKKSRKVLENARTHWPHHALVAVADAETLIETGQMEAAIPALEVALQSGSPEPEWYLLYARCLLNYDPDRLLSDGNTIEPDRLAYAQQALQKLTTLIPDHFESRLLTAETLYAQKSLPESFETYRQLADQPEAARPEWRWRLQTGFGQSALALGEVETAVAALREAAQVRPDDLLLHRLLTDAYQKAELSQGAAQAAHQALQIAPDSLSNLSWFIDKMTQLGLERETVAALTTATQLAPEQAGFWNRLARLKLEHGDPAGARQALASLISINDPGPDELCAAAVTYRRLDDQVAALACLEGAANAVETPQPSILAEIAGLRARLGNPEGALEALQRASAAAPEEISLHVFQADLLGMLKKPQAAQACLERALRLSENIPTADRDGQKALLPDGWAPDGMDESSAGIYTRFALLLRETGSLQAALHHAEKALESQPENPALHYLAADLARALLEGERALQLAQVPVLPEGQEETNDHHRWRMALQALQAELALEAGEDSDAARIIEQCTPSIPEEARYLAIQARLLAAIHDPKAAAVAYASACKQLQTEMALPSMNGLALAYPNVFGSSSPMYIAEAAFDLQRWGDGIDGFEQYARSNPLEARAQLRLARAIVICAEQQRLGATLKSSNHAPGLQAMSREAAEKFEQAIRAAKRLCASPDVASWQARGQAVFNPILQNAPAIAKLAQPGDHAPALLAVLREANNAENAIRLVHHYPETPELLVQLALCYVEIDAAKGLDAARLAVEKEPSRPLYHACHALLAEKAGQTEEARNALEIALAAWPDEPDWHAWAARLCNELGSPRDAITHWEQCLAQEPDTIDFALPLGELYLNTNQAAKAVDVLENACQVAPREPNAWILLAQAQRMFGDFDRALECADKAAELDNTSPAPHLLAGEVALQMAKTDQALMHAREALGRGRNDPAAVMFMSRVLVQKGSLSEGLAVIEKALPTMQASLPVLLERANLIHRLYGPQSALPIFLELAQQYPQDAGVMSLLAQAQADCGDLKSAKGSAYTAYHLNPDAPALNFLLGRLEHASGQLDQAIHFLSEAIRQAPADLDPYLELGQAFLERREHLQALRTYQQAIKITPRDYRPFYQAASVLRDSKDYQGAESMLRRAAELAPDDLNIRRQLGAVVALNLVHNSQEANSVL